MDTLFPYTALFRSPAGSLKASLCVRGRHLLYDYCAARGIAHQRLGKLIVATTEDEAAQLDGIDARARANGVDEMRRLDRKRTRLNSSHSCATRMPSSA